MHVLGKYIQRKYCARKGRANAESWVKRLHHTIDTRTREVQKHGTGGCLNSGLHLLHGFPIAYTGQTIGLLGGSFDPPHLGHVHITRRALRRFGLSQIWWMVSPGNPLKPDAPAAIARRIAACKTIMGHPRVRITDLEARIGTRYTADTLTQLRRLYPGVRFVWLMGADNLAGFHRWEHWNKIMETVPIGVLSRPGDQIAAGSSHAARTYSRYRLREIAAPVLARQPAPAWVLLSGPMREASSTAIRNAGKWVR